MMAWKWHAGWLAGAVMVLVNGCRPVTDAWATGWTGAEANDRIMLVRREPASLGYRRLTSQSGVYPDLGLFLNDHGQPDFLAESRSGDRHFLILYYLDSRRAYACRAKAPSTREIEFSGPYPMTEREVNLLQSYRQQAQDAPAGR